MPGCPFVPLIRYAYQGYLMAIGTARSLLSPTSISQSHRSQAMPGNKEGLCNRI